MQAIEGELSAVRDMDTRNKIASFPEAVHDFTLLSEIKGQHHQG